MLDEYGGSKDLTDIRSEGRNSVEFLYTGVAFRWSRMRLSSSFISPVAGHFSEKVGSGRETVVAVVSSGF